MRDIRFLIRRVGYVLVLALSSAGLAQTPQLVKTFGGYYTAGPPVSVNDIFFFNAVVGAAGNELWKSDGTTGGTMMVNDMVPGPGHFAPQDLINFNGKLFFRANTIATGRELWQSDGTADGTVLVKDINPFGDSILGFLTVVQNTLFFNATDGVTGYELWKSDGTAAGTVLVKDIVPGGAFSAPAYLTNVNGTLFFIAVENTKGSELWKSDGTTTGTVMIKDIRPGVFSSNPRFLFNCNGTLFFLASDGITGLELWKSDGTASGTVLVKDINPGPGDSFPGIVGGVHFANIGNTVFFQANDGTNGLELWKSDGTAAGTMLVKDINPNIGNSDPDFMINVNGTLIFRADDGSNGRELWKSDGTASGTVMIKDIRPGVAGSFGAFSLLPDLAEVNGAVYFNANNGVNGDELWKSDGTIAGTMLVQDLYPGIVGSTPRALTKINDVLFFYANDQTTGTELWKLVQAPLVADAGVDKETCAGQSTTLGGSPAASGGTAPYTFAWTPSVDLDNAAIANPTASPALTTTYTLTVTDATGNMDMDEITIGVNPAPTANAGVDRSILYGHTMKLGGNPTANGGTPPYTYSWAPTTNLDDPTAARPKVRVTNTTTYTLIVTDAKGCQATDQITVTAHEFVFIANNLVMLNQNQLSNGNIHSNGRIEFDQGASPGKHTGNLSAIDDINIDDNNIIMGNATSGADVNLSGSAVVTGIITENANVGVIQLVPELSFTVPPTAGDVSVPRNGALNLPPGVYGDVKVRDVGKLFLSAGDYFMNVLDTDPSAVLSIDVSGGPVNIHVVALLSFDSNVKVLITGTGAATHQVSFLTRQTAKLEIGRNATVQGSIIAPATEVHFLTGSIFKGSVAANDITLDSKVTFGFHSPGVLTKESEVEATDESEVADAPLTVTNYELAQNYPNPFNPVTTIQFSVPREGYVRLKVYNSFGAEAATLVDQHVAAGTYKVNWDASRLASGFYLYRLETDGFAQTKRLLLMK